MEQVLSCIFNLTQHDSTTDLGPNTLLICNYHKTERAVHVLVYSPGQGGKKLSIIFSLVFSVKTIARKSRHS